MTDPKPPEGYEEREATFEAWIVLHEEDYAVGPFSSKEEADGALWPCGHPTRVVRMAVDSEACLSLARAITRDRVGAHLADLLDGALEAAFTASDAKAKQKKGSVN